MMIPPTLSSVSPRWTGMVDATYLLCTKYEGLVGG